MRTKHTGKKSELANSKKLIGRVAPEDAARSVSLFNIEREITLRLKKRKAISKNFIVKRTEREKIDVTLPGTRPREGHLHILTILRQKIEDIFVSMGYSIEDDREIETDYYNFDALNIPEGHPARESQDTFYTTGGFALRSQTSTVQIRAMERRGVPIRIIAPGRVFRRDTPDLTHTPMFHQIEGCAGQKHHDGALKARSGMAAPFVWRKNRHAPASELLPFHRTERGIRFFLLQMRWNGRF